MYQSRISYEITPTLAFETVNFRTLGVWVDLKKI